MADVESRLPDAAEKPRPMTATDQVRDHGPAGRNACPHCKETGTCTTGPDGRSCALCVSNASHWYRKLRLDGPLAQGLQCSVCHGRGSWESFSVKLEHRFTFYFAAGFLVFTLAFIFLTRNQSSDLEKVYTSLVTILGTIAGFFFGGRAARRSTSSNNRTTRN